MTILTTIIYIDSIIEDLLSFLLNLHYFFLLLGLGMFTLPFCVIAYFLDFTRLYFYAFSAGIGFILAKSLDPIVGNQFGSIIVFGSIGGIIVVIGLYYFILFLKKYPLPKDLQEKEVADG